MSPIILRIAAWIIHRVLLPAPAPDLLWTLLRRARSQTSTGTIRAFPTTEMPLLERHYPSEGTSYHIHYSSTAAVLPRWTLVRRVTHLRMANHSASVACFNACF